LVKSIVFHPKSVIVEEKEENGFLNLIIHSHPEDIKIIIGKKGRTIKALRELAKFKAAQKQKEINIQIAETSKE